MDFDVYRLVDQVLQPHTLLHLLIAAALIVVWRKKPELRRPLAWVAARGDVRLPAGPAGGPDPPVVRFVGQKAIAIRRVKQLAALGLVGGVAALIGAMVWLAR